MNAVDAPMCADHDAEKREADENRAEIARSEGLDDTPSTSNPSSLSNNEKTSDIYPNTTSEADNGRTVHGARTSPSRSPSTSPPNGDDRLSPRETRAHDSRPSLSLPGKEANPIVPSINRSSAPSAPPPPSFAADLYQSKRQEETLDSVSNNHRHSQMEQPSLLSALSQVVTTNPVQKASTAYLTTPPTTSADLEMDSAARVAQGHSMGIVRTGRSSSIAPAGALIQKKAISTAPTGATSQVPFQYAKAQQIIDGRENVEYELTIREQPKHSRMCGVGEKTDRRPIDPAPIIQLRVITHDRPAPANKVKDEDGDTVFARAPSAAHASVKEPLQDDRGLTINTQQQHEQKSTDSLSSSSSSFLRRGKLVHTAWGNGWEDKTWYLENPHYFMYAMLADPEIDEELHLLKDGRTRYTTGSCVSCLYHLKDIDGTDQGFFVFPDLSIRVEGRYRLKLSLFERIGRQVHHCKSVFSQPFHCYTAKRFPGMDESTMLSKAFADQGLKMRIRKTGRNRRTGGRQSGKRAGVGSGSGMYSDEESDSEVQQQQQQQQQQHHLQQQANLAAGNKRRKSESASAHWQASQSVPPMPTAGVKRYHRNTIPNALNASRYGVRQDQAPAMSSSLSSSSHYSSLPPSHVAAFPPSGYIAPHLKDSPPFVRSQPHPVAGGGGGNAQQGIAYDNRQYPSYYAAPSHADVKQQPQHQQHQSFHQQQDGMGADPRRTMLPGAPALSAYARHDAGEDRLLVHPLQTRRASAAAGGSPHDHRLTRQQPGYPSSYEATSQGYRGYSPTLQTMPSSAPNHHSHNQPGEFGRLGGMMDAMRRPSYDEARGLPGQYHTVGSTKSFAEHASRSANPLDMHHSSSVKREAVTGSGYGGASVAASMSGNSNLQLPPLRTALSPDHSPRTGRASLPSQQPQLPPPQQHHPMDRRSPQQTQAQPLSMQSAAGLSSSRSWPSVQGSYGGPTSTGQSYVSPRPSLPAAVSPTSYRQGLVPFSATSAASAEEVGGARRSGQPSPGATHTGGNMHVLLPPPGSGMLPPPPFSRRESGSGKYR